MRRRSGREVNISCISITGLVSIATSSEVNFSLLSLEKENNNMVTRRCYQGKNMYCSVYCVSLYILHYFYFNCSSSSSFSSSSIHVLTHTCPLRSPGRVFLYSIGCFRQKGCGVLLDQQNRKLFPFFPYGIENLLYRVFFFAWMYSCFRHPCLSYHHLLFHHSPLHPPSSISSLCSLEREWTYCVLPMMSLLLHLSPFFFYLTFIIIIFPIHYHHFHHLCVHETWISQCEHLLYRFTCLLFSSSSSASLSSLLLLSHYSSRSSTGVCSKGKSKVHSSGV